MANFRFPSDIGATTDSITLLAKQVLPTKQIKQSVTKMDMANSEVTTDLGSVTLSLPSNINETMQHNFNITTGLTDDITSGVDAAIGGNFVYNSAKKVLDRNGFHVNPHYLQTYEGTTPRNFDCQWTFVPQNSGESNQLMNMIKHLKGWASPQPKTAKIMVDMPATWQIVFHPHTLQEMISFKNMVCIALSVNYSPAGYNDFFEDGFPKQINLSMSFSERQITYRKDWI